MVGARSPPKCHTQKEDSYLLVQTPALTVSQLRRELNLRAEVYARSRKLLHELSPDPAPSVIFGLDHAGVHGNFHPASYTRIAANPDWLRRLQKPHTASRRSAARKDWRWMELDAATSSDALLMNVFCHPDVYDNRELSGPVAALLGVDRVAQPRFGACPGVPLAEALKPRSKRAALRDGPREAFDRTEIDLVLSGPTTTLFVEAKLTESDFQTAAHALVARYRDLEVVFDPDRLPRRRIAPPPLPENVDPEDPTVNLPSRIPRERMAGYQLIRNILAAHAAEAGFCVLLDTRRHDLIDAWYAVLSAVRSLSFATRLRVLTWQELATALPQDLQHFLAEKYGIMPS
jgi:hypothetical protein